MVICTNDYVASIDDPTYYKNETRYIFKAPLKEVDKVIFTFYLNEAWDDLIMWLDNIEKLVTDSFMKDMISNLKNKEYWIF